MIAPLALEHVESVAALHEEALTGLLAELGAPAARAFYAGAIRSGLAIGFVDEEQDEVRGFVFGSLRPGELKRAAARANPAGVLAGVLRGVLRRPSRLVPLLRSFRGPDEGGYDSRTPELTYLAVRAGRREAGLGGALVDRFARTLRAAGAASCELSVDDANGIAAAFYERRGFAPVGRYREFGTLHRRYRLPLRGP